MSIITELFLAVIMRVFLFVKFLGFSFVCSTRYLNLHGCTRWEECKTILLGWVSD
jgi:hypothetical protein